MGGRQCAKFGKGVLAREEGLTFNQVQLGLVQKGEACREGMQVHMG